MDDCFNLEDENPRGKASFVSRIFFMWMKKISCISNTRPLKLKDLYRCPKSFTSNANGNNLEEIWNREVKHSKMAELKPSLSKAIMKAYYIEYCLYGFTTFLNFVVIKGIQPIVLSNLIRLFIAKNYTPYDMILYGGGQSLLVTLTSFLLHHSVCGSRLISVKIRVAVSSLIYRKMLKLSQRSLSNTAVGHVVNILSNDVARFDLAVQAFHFLWITPLQIIVIIAVMWKEFGSTALIGMVAMVLIIVPFEGFLGHLTGVYRKKAAEKTDYRVKMTNEIFSGIKLIKMYAWEKPFEKIIQKSRKEELKYIRRTSYIRGIITTFMFSTDRLGLCITVICYSLLGFPVRTDLVLAVSICFRILQYSLGTMLPAAITIGSELLVSIKRIEKFLALEEIARGNLSTAGKSDDYAVQLQNVTASWIEKSITLDRISTKISKGTLCAVVGPVGSGKSSFLKLLLEELPKRSGSIKLNGNISFSSQEPWLFPSTIRKNILFDQKFDEARYKQVIKVCGLNKDLEELPDGDNTIVGNRGISLSGGQKARVSLARAVYKKVELYIFDDILSALDNKIGKHVFDECIIKFLRKNTRIIVTHQLQYLKQADHIIVLNEGVLEKQGTFQELSNCELDFTKLISDTDNCDKKEKNTKISREYNEDKDLLEELEVSDQEKKISASQNDDITKYRGSIFWSYVKFSRNICCCVLFICLLILCQFLLNFSDYWITVWSKEENIRSLNEIQPAFHSLNNETVHTFTILRELFSNRSIPSELTDTVHVNSCKYILVKVAIMRSIYVAIILIAISLMLVRSSLFYYLCTRSSQNLHDNMFSSALGTHMKFFHKNPPGNILNRCSKDMGTIDEMLPKALINMLGSVPILFGSMVLIMISNSLMILLIIPLLLILFRLRKWFVTTVKSLRRIETSVKSPIFSYVSATLDGITTIRANKCENTLISQFDKHQDVHTSASFLAIAASSAFGLWMDLLCVTFVISIIVGFIIMDKYIYVDGSFVGLAIFQAMTMVGLFQFCIRSLSETVDYLTSVERVLVYTQLENEEDNSINDITMPCSSWPTEAKIQINNLYLKYGTAEKPVLKNLNIEILPSEKIGVVGRTGAGKSSIIAALFRLAPIEGSIFIDGIDTQSIKLNKMRGKISIIPQEPILFSSTIRFNLDPLFEFTDDKLWRVLEEVDLEKTVKSLNFEVTEGGNNFSIGERQLICLARAILRGNKILILDEATSSVDVRTDELIQKTIRKKFSDCTIITVAHRLNSVMDSDNILVMDSGQKVEFGHPYELLQNTDGYFYKLVAETGPYMFESLKKVSLQAYNTKFKS